MSFNLYDAVQSSCKILSVSDAITLIHFVNSNLVKLPCRCILFDAILPRIFLMLILDNISDGDSISQLLFSVSLSGYLYEPVRIFMIFYDCSDDIPACIRELILGLGSTSTLAALTYAFYRRLSSSYGHSRRDLLVIGLSIIQTSLSSVYYLIQNTGEIVVVARVIKVLQAILISWIFLAATYPGYPLIHCVCATGAVQSILIFSFLIVFWVPKDALCKDSIWVTISVSWFVVSLLVCLVGVRLLRSLPTDSTADQDAIAPTPIADESSDDDVNAIRIIDGRSGREQSSKYHCLPNTEKKQKIRRLSGERLIIRDETLRITQVISSVDEAVTIDITQNDEPKPKVIGRPTDDYDNRETCAIERTQIDIKKNHLLALIGVETFAAGLSMIWDIIIWFSIKEVGANACSHFLSNIPVVESIAYIISRAVALLVPHWAVFLVLYWLDRDLHRPYNPDWDVDLRAVELENLSPATLP